MISSRRRVVRSDTQSRPSIQILSRRGRLEFSPESEKTSMSLDRTTLSATPLLDWRWRKGESVPIGNFKKRAVRSFVRWGGFCVVQFLVKNRSKAVSRFVFERLGRRKPSTTDLPMFAYDVWSILGSQIKTEIDQHSIEKYNDVSGVLRPAFWYDFDRNLMFFCNFST